MLLGLYKNCLVQSAVLLEPSFLLLGKWEIHRNIQYVSLYGAESTGEDVGWSARGRVHPVQAASLSGHFYSVLPKLLTGAASMTFKWLDKQRKRFV